jgi:hypothetical protein
MHEVIHRICAKLFSLKNNFLKNIFKIEKSTFFIILKCCDFNQFNTKQQPMGLCAIYPNVFPHVIHSICVELIILTAIRQPKMTAL